MIPFAIILFVAIAILSMAWRSSRGHSMLDNWAAANGFRIINAERRSFRRGPFFFSSGKSRDVYYVTVEDSQANRRSGYIRCGGAFLGMMSDTVTVKWDDE